jgi:hypothetical protein
VTFWAARAAAAATVRGMPESSDQMQRRRREAVEREMRIRREADEERQGRELVDTVEEQQQRDRLAAERDDGED